jgi:hypothetical protein
MMCKKIPNTKLILLEKNLNENSIQRGGHKRYSVTHPKIQEVVFFKCKTS